MASIIRSKQTGNATSPTLSITAPGVKNTLVAFITQFGSVLAPTLSGWTVNVTKAVFTTSANSIWMATKEASGSETLIEPTPASGGTIQGICYYELLSAGWSIEGIGAANNGSGKSNIAPPTGTPLATGILGNDVPIPTSSASPAAGQQLAWQVEAFESTTYTEFHLRSKETTGVTSVWMGIFADNAGQPGALLGQAQFSGAVAQNTWITVGGLSVPVRAGTKYWLACIAPEGALQVANQPEGEGGATTTQRKSKKTTYTKLTETSEWEAAQARGPLGMYMSGPERANENVILAAVGLAASSGPIEAFTGTGPMTNVSTEASRCLGGYYEPSQTFANATFTANWNTSRTNGMLVVALRPLRGKLLPLLV